MLSKIFKSTDGKNWEQQDANGLISGVVSTIFIPSLNRFVAIGSSSYIYLSSNGIDWESYNILAWLSSSSNRANKVVYAAGKYVFVADDAIILTTEDFVSFQRYKLNLSYTLRLNAITYGNRIFVAGGARYRFTSSDGANWTPLANGFPFNVKDMIFANNKFVIMGEGSEVAVSEDAINWTAGTSVRGPGNIGITGISINYINGLFLAAGYYLIPVSTGNMWYRTVYVSSDLETWQKVFSQSRIAASLNFPLTNFASNGNNIIIYASQGSDIIIKTDALQLPVIENAYIKALE